MTHFMKVITVIIFITVITVITKPAFAYTISPVDDVMISAYVGETGIAPPTPTPPPGKGGRFNLFGYTSPYAKVSINNPGMYSDTNADATGYFEFTNFFSKLLVEDICLIAQDQGGRVTMPVCIPPIPTTENQSVGPVIMPPTISINNDSFFVGDTITVTGQTTPDTDIKLSMFTDESKTSFRALLNPIRPAYAATLPKVDIKVHRSGEFAMTIPSNDPQYYRTFAQTVFHQSFSPKSVTLNFDIFPGWFIIMRFILGLINGLKSHWLEIALLTQIILITYWLLHRYFHPHHIALMRALTIRQHPPLMLTSHELLMQKHDLLLQEHELLLKQLERHILN